MTFIQLSSRVFPTTGFKAIPTSETTEEEHWPWYTTTQSVLAATTATIWMSAGSSVSFALSVLLCETKLIVASHGEYVCIKSILRSKRDQSVGSFI